MMSYLVTITRAGMYRQEIRYETLEEMRAALATRFGASQLIETLDLNSKGLRINGALVTIERTTA